MGHDTFMECHNTQISEFNNMTTVQGLLTLLELEI